MRRWAWLAGIGVVVLCACLAPALGGRGAKKLASARQDETVHASLASSSGLAAKKVKTPREWNQWRGPNRDGSSGETGWTYQWSGMGPRELWRIRLAPGYSTVSVRNGLVYTNGGTYKDESVSCLNARNGSQVWKFTFPTSQKFSWKWTRGAYATPTVDGKLVFAQSMSGYVAALDADTGKEVWGRDLVQESGKVPPVYGYSSSPLVVDGLVIVAGGLGIEKTTGKIVWKSDKIPANYPSPVPILVGKERGVVFVSDRFVCVKASTGEVLWEIPRGCGNMYADPVVRGDQVLFWNSLYKVVDGKPTRVYCTSYSPDDGSLYGSPVLWKGYVFKLSNTLTCREFDTGQLKWTKEGIGGTVTLADGKLVILTKDGQLVVAEASTDAYKELARARVFKEQGDLRDYGVWSAPVLSDGRLYLRNYDELACLDLRGK